MKKLLLIILIVVLSFSFAGCSQKKAEFDTMTGKPEVVINNISKSKIINRLNEEMLKREYTINEESENKIVYGKESDSILASVMFGSDYDSTPEARITYNFVEYEEKDKVRVIATLEAITNPGSAHERKHDMTYSEDGKKYFEIMRDMKKDLEG
ncbi:MAG: hypothetical protein ACOCQA_00705 [bacterium]